VGDGQVARNQEELDALVEWRLRARNLAEESDRDPAVRRARHLLRRMHAELGEIDLRGVPPAERRAFRLLLGHLESGFLPEVCGSA
jgi:hypothetical protein